VVTNLVTIFGAKKNGLRPEGCNPLI
jgi:hypothetical protein